MSYNQKVGVIGASGMVGEKAMAVLGRMGYDTVGYSVREGIEHIDTECVISCLPAEVAMTVEVELATKGIHVFSNAAAHRMNKHVPILVPEVNLESLSWIEDQTTPGKIVTNSNCAVVFVTMGLKPLVELGGVRHVSVVTMQSVSGAGKNGVPGIEGNVIPWINGEESKIKAEANKILDANLNMQVHVNRVPVAVGHTAVVHLEMEDAVTEEDLRTAWNLDHITLYDKEDRPQPRLDIGEWDMGAHIGRIQIEGNRVGFVVMGNNLMRGAAGAAVLNMEVFMRERAGVS